MSAQVNSLMSFKSSISSVYAHTHTHTITHKVTKGLSLWNIFNLFVSVTLYTVCSSYFSVIKMSLYC